MINQKERRLARECIVKILYQRDLTDYSFDEISDSFVEKRKYDNEYLKNLLDLLDINLESIDNFIIENTDLNLDNLTPIDKAIIRLAMCEFLYRDDIPGKVSINESVLIAKKFSTDDSYKFINTILDQIYKYIT
ncbi:MAG: transcription antitermination factor NusB [Gammaproteobacteria bacterium]